MLISRPVQLHTFTNTKVPKYISKKVHKYKSTLLHTHKYTNEQARLDKPESIMGQSLVCYHIFKEYHTVVVEFYNTRQYYEYKVF